MKSLKLKVKSLKSKTVIFFYLTFCILYFASVTNADAAYKIYLKNGSVIKGVSHYEKSEGEIKFYFEGSMIGVPEHDVLKIESAEEPVKDVNPSGETPKKEEPSQAAPERVYMPADDSAKETSQPEATEKKSDEAAQKEAELKRLEEDLQRTMVRVQVLYNKSVKGTITTEERSMLQQNMAKKKNLEEDKKRLVEELKALKEGRN